jgi:hypothetical protein
MPGQYGGVADDIVTIAPFRWCLGPDDFQTAGDSVISVSSANAVSPPKVLHLKCSVFRGRTQV